VVATPPSARTLLFSLSLPAIYLSRLARQLNISLQVLVPRFRLKTDYLKPRPRPGPNN
jgi:hypothetical protein